MLGEPELGCDTHDHAAFAKRAESYTIRDYEGAAGMFRMLGDATRLRLLSLLAGGEMCVSEIAQQLKESGSNISHRLRLLKSERLVNYRRQGKHVHYRLADDHILHLVQNALDHAKEPGRKTINRHQTTR